MSQENLAIWNHACRTNPSATKTDRQGGRNQTSIDGYWMLKKATELWGAMGSGWGYKIIEERFDVGAPIFRQVDGKDVEIAKTTTHTMKIKLWYMVDGEKKSVYQYGHTPYVYKSKWGATTETEHSKKSLTDAIKKSLSMLGFCADIFTGQFDDSNYVFGLRTEFDIAESEEAEAAASEKVMEFNEWCKTESESYKKIPNKAALKLVYNGHIKRIQGQATILNLNANAYIAAFDEKYHEAMAEIEAKKES